jgi:hypothetical protein
VVSKAEVVREAAGFLFRPMSSLLVVVLGPVGSSQIRVGATKYKSSIFANTVSSQSYANVCESHLVHDVVITVPDEANSTKKPPFLDG